MLSPRWKKVLRDIWRNKVRAILVILSIAVGSFALGTVLHLQVLVGRDMVASYQASAPAQIIISTAEGFDQDFIAAIRRTPGVRAVSGRRSVTMKFHRIDDATWYPIRIFALADYEQIEVNKIQPERQFDPQPELWPRPDVWPPPDRALTLERTSLLVDSLGFGNHVAQGNLVVLETPTGKTREIPLSGLCYDLSRQPATFSGMAIGYVTLDTLEWLGLPQDFNELQIVTQGDPGDWDGLKALARELQDRVERSGYTVTKVDVPEPGKLPMDNLFQAIVLILGAMGAFSLFLAVFLVVNTISALLTQQVRQIGVMKAIGARSDQLSGMYLTMVGIFGVASLAVAVPLAIYVSYEAISIIAYFINYEKSGFRVSPLVLLVQVLVGVLVPVLAAFYPVMAGARITVREAISSYGMGAGALGTGWIDRLVESVRGLPRPLLLSLRNTFRRKVRLGLTLLTLLLAGAVFIGVVSVRASMDATMDELFDYWQYDVQITFARSYRIERVVYEAEQVPGITQVEGWASASAYRLRPDGSEGASFGITAPPAGTQMLRPQLVAGRWIQPGDTNQLVINNTFWKQEPDLEMGDTITLRLNGRDVDWQVVGVVSNLGNVPEAFATYEYLSYEIRDVGSASSLQVQTVPDDPASLDAVAAALEQRYEAEGVEVMSKFTTAQLRSQNAVFFDIITTLLMIMAILMAVVGGLGLAGTMSLNVLERTREIGVMRAVGASDDALMQIFITEGVFIGFLSWVGGSILAVPLGAVLSYEVGLRLINVPFSYRFSFVGLLIWLGLVLILAVVATYLPAERAARLSVREVLSYE